MSHLVKIELATGRCIVKSVNLSSVVVGEGYCLSAAIDDLESKLAKLQLTEYPASQDKKNPAHQELDTSPQVRTNTQ